MSPSCHARPDRRGRTALATVALAAVTLAALPTSAVAAPDDAPTERIVVAYETEVAGTPPALPGTVSDDIEALGIQVLEVPADEVDDALQRLQADARVRFAEPDPVVTADELVPNDPLWSQQWGARRIGAPAAWRHTTGHRSVVVAVLDSGVDATHPDLRGAVLGGRSFVAGTSSTADDNGHGTAAAGLIAARGNNRAGIAGLCWDCRILPVKVLDRTGTGTMSAVANGLVWAADQGAQVASLSLSSPDDSRTMTEAIRYARDKGVLVVASAGNNGTTQVRYPAGNRDVLAVAGTTDRDGRYSWSNHGSWVDIAAPGCNTTTRRGGDYQTFCGTSSATPMVAGTAALAFAARPTATAAQVRDALTRTAVSTSFVASGRVRAEATLRQLGSTPTSTPTTGSSTPGSDAAARSITHACPGDGAAHRSWAGVHAPGIACLDHWAIGTFPLANYRPAQALTRSEFAAILDRTLDATERLDQPARPVDFRDIRGHHHQRAIVRLAGLGVIEGYPDGTFGPDLPIRRDQMASLMARVAEQRYGLQLAAPAGAPFRDVPVTSPHATSVAKLAAAGITVGTGAQHYTPGGDVTRAQTATFVARLLDLLVVEEAVTAR